MRFAITLLLLGLAGHLLAQEVYELRTYTLANTDQVAAVDRFLETTYLPALHAAGVKTVGVFHPIANDTAKVKRIYVWTPYKNWKSYGKISRTLASLPSTRRGGTDNYLDAPHNQPPYLRMETVLMEAFSDMPRFAVPKLKGPRADRVYELRSYESATEKLYRNKVDMFNAGGEIALFDRLGFNAVFYGDVVAGAHMPNLMYMTTFENIDDRNAHWKTFVADPDWIEMRDKAEYQNNVSHIDIMLLRPTDYSDF